MNVARIWAIPCPVRTGYYLAMKGNQRVARRRMSGSMCFSLVSSGVKQKGLEVDSRKGERVSVDSDCALSLKEVGKSCKAAFSLAGVPSKWSQQASRKSEPQAKAFSFWPGLTDASKLRALALPGLRPKLKGGGLLRRPTQTLP